jgi:hypothetical protein
MRRLPTNKRFSLSIGVTLLNVKKTLDAYILFPLLGEGYAHFNYSNMDGENIVFDIPELNRFSLEDRGTARVFVLPDDRIQELLHVDYDLIGETYSIKAVLKEDREVNKSVEVKFIEENKEIKPSIRLELSDKKTKNINISVKMEKEER